MNRISTAWKIITKGELPEPPKDEPLLQRATELPNHFFAGREQRIGLTDEISQATLLRAFKGWSAIATNAIADEVMSLRPFVAVKRIRENGVVQFERLDDHPLADLLNNPSPNFSRISLQRLLALWIAQRLGLGRSRTRASAITT